jgi:hypothetical protein
MQIHTNKLSWEDLHRELPKGCWLDVSLHGSRSRARRFDVRISAEHGEDAHGIKRCYAQNTGQYGGETSGDRAATYIEWGDWMVALFKLDPEARIGIYESPSDFVEKTRNYAPHRPTRENARRHAIRWELELSAVAA